MRRGDSSEGHTPPLLGNPMLKKTNGCHSASEDESLICRYIQAPRWKQTACSLVHTHTCTHTHVHTHRHTCTHRSEEASVLLNIHNRQVPKCILPLSSSPLHAS